MRSGIATIISHRWSRKSWISLFLSTVDRNRSNLSRFRADQIVHAAVLRVHRLAAATSAAVVYPRPQAEEERSPLRLQRLFGTDVFCFCFFSPPRKCNLVRTRCSLDMTEWPEGGLSQPDRDWWWEELSPIFWQLGSARLGSAAVIDRPVEVSMEVRLARQWPCFPMTENEDTAPPRHWDTSAILEALLKDALQFLYIQSTPALYG